MVRLSLSLLALCSSDAAWAPPAGTSSIVGNMRVSMLSPTLVRIEAKGPHGFEDRPTFMALNRSLFPVKITKQTTLTNGSVQLDTQYYSIVLPKPPQQSVTANKDTCISPTVGMDASSKSQRTGNQPVGLLSLAGCCAACNDEPDCVGWVLSTTNASCAACKCYLMATFVPEKAGGRISGGTFSPTPPPTPKPPVQGPVAILGPKAESPSTTSLVSLSTPNDFVCSGGASITADPLLNIRSGNPETETKAVLTAGLAPGVIVDSVKFSYR